MDLCRSCTSLSSIALYDESLNASQVSFYTFVSPLASSMMAPGLPEIGIKYGITSETILAMTLSIFLLSFAMGPLVLAPLSEMYGRTWVSNFITRLPDFTSNHRILQVLHIGNIFSVAFNIGCAYAPNTNALIGLRFLCMSSCIFKEEPVYSCATLIL